jgi:integrase
MMKKVEQYLAHKRSLGYKLISGGLQLRSFARYADFHAPAGPLTVDLVLRWATSPKGTPRTYHAHRLSVVRTFARYLAVFDPRTEIPPQQLLGSADIRIPPHIYTRREVSMLIRDLLIYRPSSLRRDPYIGPRNATIVGLLACTGMRIGEVLALKNSDVDLNRNVITVRQSKDLPTRLVPITRSASGHLRQYQKVRDQRFNNPGDADAFFRTPRGYHVPHSMVELTFRWSRKRVGLESAMRRKPRLHDLRHTFACNHLLRAYQENRNINNAVHDLSVYLGHVNLAATYWYISAVPALLKLCAKRSEALGLRSRKGGRS